MKSKVLFIYEFPKRTPAQSTKMNRQLFGYVDQSLHGKYLYQRKGLLSPYNIERLGKGMFITDEINQQKITKILHDMGTKNIKRYFFELKKIIG